MWKVFKCGAGKGWADSVRNEEVLHTVMEDRDILYPTETKANWTGHILHRDGLLKHANEGKNRRYK